MIIGTGTHAALEAIPGLAEAQPLTHIEALELDEVDEIPEHLLVLGGAYVGIELAQAMRRFGSKVSVIDRGSIPRWSRTDRSRLREVNERLETTAPGAWALGEVAGSPQFTHISADDSRVLRDNLAGGNHVTTGRQVPFCLFTDPEFARVGLSENEAQARGIAYRLFKIPMDGVLRARAICETRGFLKALVEADGDRILGFTSFLCRRWRGHGRRTDCNDLRITLHGPSRSNPDSPNLRGGAQCVVFVRSLRSEISQRD